MKTSAINFSTKTGKMINETRKHDFSESKSFKNFLLTVLMLATTVIANAQSIEDQATKAGNDAFATAMIRNVFIIIGIVVFFAWSGSKKSKDDKKA